MLSITMAGALEVMTPMSQITKSSVNEGLWDGECGRAMKPKEELS